MSYAHLFKIILLGDSGVGKTSFGERLATGDFVDDGSLTIGVDFHSKLITREGQQIKLQIWDTAGQEQYRSIVQAYFKGVAGVVLMFDASSESSFNGLSRWLEDFRGSSWNPGLVPIMLIANKIDLPRVVQASRAAKFARENNLIYEEVSARAHRNITASISRLVDEIYIRFVAEDRGCPGVKAGTCPDALLPRGHDVGDSGIRVKLKECCAMS